MKDLMNISEYELREMSYDGPHILDDLVIEGGLKLDKLAELFVKQPILRDSILRISDPVQLYEFIYYDLAENTNPLDYERDSKGLEETKAKYVSAFNYIKQYVYEHEYEFEGTTIPQMIEYAPVEIEDWDDPYRTGWKETLKKSKEELSKNDQKIYTLFGGQFTEKQIMEMVYEEGALYYWDIIDVIRENENVRDAVCRKILALEPDSEEYADYQKLLDEIRHIRGQEQLKKLQQKETELSALEVEERTISEAEALIDKQNAKEGQNLGE